MDGSSIGGATLGGSQQLIDFSAGVKTLKSGLSQLQSQADLLQSLADELTHPTAPAAAPAGPPPPPTIVGSGADVLSLGVSEDYYLDHAVFVVTVDGKPICDTQTVTVAHGAGLTQIFDFHGDFGPGPHTVGVSFLNDAYGGSPAKDRNLYVDQVAWNGKPIANGRASLHYTGTAAFAIPAAAAGAGGAAAVDPPAPAAAPAAPPPPAPTPAPTPTPPAPVAGPQPPLPAGPLGPTSATGTATGVITLSNYILQDNFQGGVLAAIQLTGSNMTSPSCTCTVRDNAIRFGGDGNYLDMMNKPMPPPGTSHQVDVAYAQAGIGTLSRSFVVNALFEAPPTDILFTPGVVSTSLPRGALVGIPLATDADGKYAWKLTESGNGMLIQAPGDGAVTIWNPPTAPGPVEIEMQVVDGTADKSFSKKFVIPVRAGTRLPPDKMTFDIAQAVTNKAWTGQDQAIGVNPNVLITPHIDPALFNGPIQWSYTVTSRAADAPADLDPVPDRGGRFKQDLASGAIRAAGYLSAGSYFVQFVASDGVTTCVATAELPVGWCQGPTVHVGPGQQYPSFDAFFDHAWYDTATDYDGTVIVPVPGADFSGDLTNGVPSRGRFFHPFKLQVPAGQPRAIFGNGCGYYGKAVWDLMGVDVVLEGIEVRGARLNESGRIAGIFKDGGLGNVTLRNCDIHDNDDGYQGGNAGVQVFMYGCRFAGNGSGEAGRNHGVYVASADAFVADNNVFEGAEHGHNVKSRANVTVITNNRVMSGQLGRDSYLIDIPDGGDIRIEGNLLQKGPRAENASLIHIGGEFDNQVNDPKPLHRARVAKNTFVNECGQYPAFVFAIAVNNDGANSSVDGSPMTVTLEGNAYWGFDPAHRVLARSSYPLSETSPTLLSAPPKLDFSAPMAPPTQRATGFPADPGLDLGFDEIWLPVGTPVGTKVGNPLTLGGKPVTGLKLLQDAGKYAASGPDGLVTRAALTAGVDFVQASVDGGASDWFAIVVG